MSAHGETLARLEEISEAARERRAKCDAGLSSVMGGADIDFMSAQERAERHALLMSLPTFCEERSSAQRRIAERHDQRRIAKQAGAAQ